MMFIMYFFYFLSSSDFAAAETCGIVRLSKSQPLVILEDLQSAPTVLRYKVMNPEGFDWLPGSCTCVEGQLFVPGQNQKGKWDYLLDVEYFESVDETGRDCRPVFFP